MLAEDGRHRRAIGNVGFHERDTRIFQRVVDVQKTAGVRQLVNDDDPIGSVREGVADEIRSDEPRAAGDEQCSQTSTRA